VDAITEHSGPGQWQCVAMIGCQVMTPNLGAVFGYTKVGQNFRVTLKEEVLRPCCAIAILVVKGAGLYRSGYA